MAGSTLNSPIKIDIDEDDEDDKGDVAMQSPPPSSTPIFPSVTSTITTTTATTAAVATISQATTPAINSVFPGPLAHKGKGKGKQRQDSSYDEVQAVLASVRAPPDDHNLDPDFVSSHLPSSTTPLKTRGTVRRRSASLEPERNVRSRGPQSWMPYVRALRHATDQEERRRRQDEVEEAEFQEALRLSRESMEVSERGDAQATPTPPKGLQVLGR